MPGLRTCLPLALQVRRLAGSILKYNVHHKSLERNGSTLIPLPEEAPADSPAEQMPTVRVPNEASTGNLQTPQTDPVEGETVEISKQSDEAPANRRLPSDLGALTGRYIYHNYYGAVLDRIFRFVSERELSTGLQDLGTDSNNMHYASIVFSISFTQMFTGHIIWKGIVYRVLIILGGFSQASSFCALQFYRRRH